MDDKEYIDHFFAYLTAIRLLNKNKINQNDLEIAYSLLEFFIKNYEKLYGPEHLT